jgi:hypothetical protein
MTHSTRCGTGWARYRPQSLIYDSFIVILLSSLISLLFFLTPCLDRLSPIIYTHQVYPGILQRGEALQFTVSCFIRRVWSRSTAPVPRGVALHCCASHCTCMDGRNLKRSPSSRRKGRKIKCAQSCDCEISCPAMRISLNNFAYIIVIANTYFRQCSCLAVPQTYLEPSEKVMFDSAHCTQDLSSRFKDAAS